MKRILLLTFLFSSIAITLSAQNSELKYNREFVAFKGCDDAENLESCFSDKFQDFLLENIKTKDVEALIASTKKDTLTIFSYLFVEKNGKVDRKRSRLEYNKDATHVDLMYTLKSLPEIKPQLDAYDNPLDLAVSAISGFAIDRSNNTLSPLYGFIPEVVPFSIIEKVPIYSGCDETLSNKYLKKCMSDEIAKVVSANFSQKVIRKSKLPKGLVRIYVSFKINKKGEVVDIRARAPKHKLEKEAIRVIQLIPILEKPGYQRGKPVTVPYSLPIVFNVE